MKDKVFIIWSGSNETAVKIKRILEHDHNYICTIGGNSDNNSDFASVGDTVLQQIKACNQAIVIFQNKADGTVSNNLYFELGYVFASYGAKKVHCVKRRNDNVVLPSDFDSAFVEPIDSDDEDKFVNGIIDYFLGRQKMSIDVNKMVLINTRYRIRDMIQKHYSENGSSCSDYELAQYVLFYMQAAQMFNDVKHVQEEITAFKRQHNHEFSEELDLAVNVCLAFFDLVSGIYINSAGKVCCDDDTFFRFNTRSKESLEELKDDDFGSFGIWAKLFIVEQLTYAHLLFAENVDNEQDMREMLYEKCISLAEQSLEIVAELEATTPCRENNDSVGLISLIKAYLYRNTFCCMEALGIENRVHWLEKAKREHKSLIRHYDQGAIDSKLYDNFRMEYYLNLSEYMSYADDGSMDKFEKKMYLNEINKYLKLIEQEEDANIYVKKIGEYYQDLKTQ